MAGLFKNKIIKAELEKFEIPDFDNKIKVIQNWLNFYNNGELAKKTETQCEQSFNQDIFINVLGYKPFPADVYNIIPQDSVDVKGGQKPDATLGYFEKDKKRVVAVVEIKDANTPLDKSQRRDGNLSPIQQAFKYKPQFEECGFVIATNFIEIRLFRDTQLDFEKFTLKDLVNPEDDYFNFRKFYYILSAENLVAKAGQTTTEKILSNIRIEQEKITHKFYNQYKSLRSDLIRDILINNPETKRKEGFLVAVEKAQKLVDRIVFICFLEDSGLLPQDKLLEVIGYADKIGVSSWSLMKDFFVAVDRGSEKLDIPDGYNGELFKPDSALDGLILSDDVCNKFAELSKFDFAEDLSVNILGHIFEQSISDLEAIKSLSEEELTGKVKTVNKRKKDGVYYTPEYIVDYIVQNSLGKYLEDKEFEILAKYNLQDGRLKDKGYDKKIVDAYEEYMIWIRDIKILDPACGSGAFLVKVFDYLLAEHKRVYRIVNDAQGNTINSAFLSDDDYIKPILEKNIYGVDLNPESVEITKLSLWLKSAKKGKKLITLKGNIKCGNSLVSDPEVAGERAFDWQTEFKEIFDKGGFDVIVGNPPYIKEYTNKEAFDGLHSSPYYEGKMDLWQFFTCVGIDLLKPNGYISYIAPSSWLTNSGAKKTRNKVLADSKMTDFIDFGDYNVFYEAGIQTMIFVLRKTKTDNGKTNYLKLNKQKDVPNSLNHENIIKFKQSEFIDKPITFIENPEDNNLLDKILSKNNFELDKKEVAQGIVPNPDIVNKRNITSIEKEDLEKYNIQVDDGVFVLKKDYFKNKITDTESKYIKPVPEPYLVDRYYYGGFDKEMIYITKKNYSNDAPNLLGHLSKFKSIMNLRRENILERIKYYHMHWAREESFFKKGEKILAVRKCKHPTFIYTTQDAYVMMSFNVIKTDRLNMKYLTGLFNSNLIKYWLKNKGKMQGNNFQVDKEPLLNIPICVADDNTQKEVVERVERIISKNTELQQTTNQVVEMLRHELGLEKISKKLENFYTLSFDEFVELGNREFSIDKKQELMNYFNKTKKDVLNLKNEISRVDNEIDTLVYSVYGLDDKEIKIING